MPTTTEVVPDTRCGRCLSTGYTLRTVVDRPVNLHETRAVREGRLAVNADGFYIGNGGQPMDRFCEYCTMLCSGCSDRFCDTNTYRQHITGGSCVDCGDNTCVNTEHHECYECESTMCGSCHSDYSECSDCRYQESDDYNDSYGSGGVREWNYRPSRFKPKGDWKRKANRPRNPLMGVELEVNGRHSDILRSVQSVDATEDHLYVKTDGSISGLEIVTHPMTLEWAKSYQFDAMIDALNANGCNAPDGYGLHIHVSRNAFRKSSTSSHQMTWLMFMYQNEAALVKLARRQDDRWASFRKPEKGELRRKAGATPSRDDRYVAINCNNEKTYEMRFFKSTTNKRDWWAALEFADASVRYTDTIKVVDVMRAHALHWGRFATWVKKLKGTYPNLHAAILEMPEDLRTAPRPTKPPKQTNGARDARRALRTGRKAAELRAKARKEDQKRIDAAREQLMAVLEDRRQDALDQSTSSRMYPRMAALLELIGPNGVMTHVSSDFATDDRNLYTFGEVYYTDPNGNRARIDGVSSTGWAPVRTASGVDLSEFRDFLHESNRLYRQRYW